MKSFRLLKMTYIRATSNTIQQSVPQHCRDHLYQMSARFASDLRGGVLSSIFDFLGPKKIFEKIFCKYTNA